MEEYIHYRHLHNTKNKKWIMNCQCSDCLSENLLTDEEKEFFYRVHDIYERVYNINFNENTNNIKIKKQLNGIIIEFI